MLTTHKNGDSGGIRDGVWHSFYHIIAKSGFLYIYIYIIFELSQLFDVVFDTSGGPIDF